MKDFKLSLIAAALVAGGVTFASAGVMAQQNDASSAAKEQVDEEKIETIEVVGFGTSLIKSLNQKRFSDTVSEQISADDLGALPDVSMADALTRLPGISAVRTGGQAAEINIRGMSGDFVFSTLNGREQMSTSGKRSIEFDQYPSELISSAAVYKSPKVSLIEGGIAGTVELQTANPLSNDKKHSFNANVRAMHNDRASEIPDAKEYGNRFSLSYQGKYLDETLGVAFGYARLYQPSVSSQFVGLAFNNPVEADGVADDTDGTVDCPSCEFTSEGMELQHKGGLETRDGFMGVVEWAPTDNFVLKTDVFYSKFQTDAFARGLRAKFGGASIEGVNPILAGNAVIGANIFRNANSTSFTRVEITNDDNTETDEISSVGINADWQISDDLSLNFDVAHSKAESNFRNSLLWALVAEDANAEVPVFDQNVSISYLLNGLNIPDVGFNQTDDFSDINKVMVSKYGIYPYVNSDRQNSYKLDFKYELDNDFIASIEVGARYSERTFTNDRSVFEYGDDGAFSVNEGPLQLTSDMAQAVSFGGEFANFPDYLAIDVNAALNAWFPNGVPSPQQTWGNGNPDVINSPGGTKQTSWSVLQSGDVYEDILAAYVMANIDMEIFDIPVTGNIGVRMVETDQSATALEDVNGDPLLGAQNIADGAGLVNGRYAPKILGMKYTDYLPQLNLNFRLTDTDQVRFAAAKVMSRPPIERLAAQLSTNISDQGVISGESKNNPFLRPYYATQYDLSYERYFDETDGAFIAALFYKDLDSTIDTFGITNFDFAGNGFNVPDFVVDEFDIPVATTNGVYTTAVNNKDAGYIRGIELAYTQIYSFLPSPFSGLGVNASYSYTESEVTVDNTLSGTTQTLTFKGLSENVFTATVFWEYEDFETRLSARYRDDFVSDQVAIESQTVNFKGETVLDYQISYQLSEATKLLFQINNLTDEPTRSYFVQESQTGTIQFFGRQIFLGMTYSL
jgi:iron complex outermembrane receptor protein